MMQMTWNEHKEADMTTQQAVYDIYGIHLDAFEWVKASIEKLVGVDLEPRCCDTGGRFLAYPADGRHLDAGISIRIRANHSGDYMDYPFLMYVMVMEDDSEASPTSRAEAITAKLEVVDEIRLVRRDML